MAVILTYWIQYFFVSPVSKLVISMAYGFAFFPAHCEKLKHDAGLLINNIILDYKLSCIREFSFVLSKLAASLLMFLAYSFRKNCTLKENYGDFYI